MCATYNCLSCGLSLAEAEAGTAGKVARCPKCGRDMYRQQRAAASVTSRYGGGAPAVGEGGYGVTPSSPALPSRYGGVAGAERFMKREEDEDHNPIVVLHTPFIVGLGLILSFL